MGYIAFFMAMMGVLSVSSARRANKGGGRGNVGGGTSGYDVPYNGDRSNGNAESLGGYDNPWSGGGGGRGDSGYEIYPRCGGHRNNGGNGGGSSGEGDPVMKTILDMVVIIIVMEMEDVVLRAVVEVTQVMKTILHMVAVGIVVEETRVIKLF
ncbi:hypothetical protein ACH5RR_017891 [Cinchona calisaya]|uniref:Glycine-rich protein n=1 Tax=Cinchona calisaya TaxID=153742 RepID=A0ABD2ZMT0_9GENT